MLDSHWRCGGLLMATADVDTGNWPITMPSSPAPKIRWQGGRPCGILLCCAGFVLASFLVPGRFLDDLGSQRLLVGAEVEKLAEKIELLKEEKILPPERAKSLELALEQLQRDASGSDPAKTWEAMDHLDQSVAQASARSRPGCGARRRQGRQGRGACGGSRQGPGPNGPAQLTDALRILAKDVQRTSEENSLLASDLADELRSQCEQGSLSKERLAELAKQLGECKSCKLSKLKKLAAAGLIDESLLAEILQQCESDPDGLAKLLAECDDPSELELCLAQCDLAGVCNRPGRGGVTRGRGDAAMTWTDGTSRDDTAFKEKVLPPGAMASLKDSRLQGISVGDPTAAEPSEPSAGGALNVSNAGRRLSPHAGDPAGAQESHPALFRASRQLRPRRHRIRRQQIRHPQVQHRQLHDNSRSDVRPGSGAGLNSAPRRCCRRRNWPLRRH